MNTEQKKRLQELKNINKEKNNSKTIENNILLRECIEAINTNGLVLEKDMESSVYSNFERKLFFTPWGIDWERGKNITNVRYLESQSNLKEFCTKDCYYIIWGKDFPIIKCGLEVIIKNLDDIRAVEADTWLFSIDHCEVIEFYHEGKITIGEIGL